VRGLALALSWLTVLPVRTGAPSAATAAAAIRWAPVVGGLLGAAGGGVLLGLAALGVPPLVAGLLTVGFLGLATRGMHLDGLADVADGLGCYGPPERALAVMRDGGAGPFGVVALVVAVGVQAAALAAVPPASALLTVALAAAAGRAGFALAGIRGVLAVVLGAGPVVLLSWHTARRLGGMTGDVLGAASELATTVALVALVSAP
jgi:adenosylcobinamide-GDP ribazoletransferase